MNILLVNDDGVHANGLNLLYEDLHLFHDVCVVAPDRERSCCGHALTLAEPLRLKSIKENFFSCNGLPADCVLLGLGVVLADKKPNIVISGINHGANLGQDHYYSGTVAGAREAVFRGHKGMALSLVYNGTNQTHEHFETATRFCQEILKTNIIDLLPARTVLNVNIPNMRWEEIAGVKRTISGFQLYSEEVIGRLDRHGKTYYWVGGVHHGQESIAGSDCEALSQSYIAMTVLDITGGTASNIKAMEDLDYAISEFNKNIFKS